MPILDTDILSIVQERQEPFYTRLLKRLDMLPPDAEVWTTIVSFEEQLRGWLEYVKRAQSTQLAAAYAKLYELHSDFSTRPVLLFDADCEDVYTRLLREKIRVGTMDLKIAAIAIARNELLLSKNLKDFRRGPGLRVEDWTA